MAFKRQRLKNPKLFDPRSFRVKKISKKKELIVGCPKGKFDMKKGKCGVGMKAQAILTRK